MAVTLAACALSLVPVVPPKLYEPPLPADARDHWSFRPPTRVAPPAAGHPVDAFVRAKLAAAGVEPSPPADKRTLVRRVSFDLTGLPPTPAEVEAFVTDTSPDAYEKLVDRLLASPHFGERWAQHWLDVVRFAETNGYELDADRPHAWRYRDYVIRSFNADKPYSVFLREQVAGDELAAGKDPKAVPDLLIATGLHRCGPAHVVSGNLNPDELRQERLTEMVNGLGAAVLGLTMGCARCHDHKFDPISQADYYRLQAFFETTEFKEYHLSPRAEREAFDAAVEAVKGRVAPLQKEIQQLEAPYRAKLTAAKRAALDAATQAAFATPGDKRTAEQRKLVKDAGPLVMLSWDEVLESLSPADRATRDALREQIRKIEAETPDPPAKASGLAADESPRLTHVLKRGDATRKAAVVFPQFPTVLVSTPVRRTTRTELADWLTTPDHPLTARVMVNRLWHHYFGRGIVGTVNDFGTRGDRPTHPELLDFLATELVEGGWTLKRVHKRIVTSATYKQSAAKRDMPADPENKLLWRMNRKRLDAEALRDAVLAAAGTLNRKAGGPSVRVPLEPEVYDLIFTEGEPDGLWPVTLDASEHARRSVYLFNKRNVRLPMLEAFDQPDTLTPCNGRGVSTFAPQALILMNGPFVRDQSRTLAAKLSAADPVGDVYRRAVGRGPTAAERAAAERFVEEQAESVRARLLARRPVPRPARESALADLCLAVLNLNEFVYVP